MKNVKENKSVIISGVICILILILTMGIIGLMESETEDIDYAESYEQLAIYVEFPEGMQKIKVWKDAEKYIFFLPSGAENYRMTFGNLGGEKESTVRLENTVYTSKESITEVVEYGQEYDVELSVAGQTLGVETITFIKSDKLPSLYINTQSGSLENIHADRETKEAAVMTLLEADGRCLYSDDLEYIKTRGNSSFWDFEKKSYQIKLREKNAILGMESAQKWILAANAIDDSLMKNELIFHFAEEHTSLPSIQGKHVDLYLNGEYRGNYYLCEKVEVDEKRLNITDLEEKTEQVNFQESYSNITLYVSEDEMVKGTVGLNNPEDITGGYLLEMIRPSAYEIITNGFMTDTGRCYEIVSPKQATKEQVEYIRNIFNEMETAMLQPDGFHPTTGKHFSEYLDVESWVYKYLIEEIFHNPDAINGRSAFFYKEADNVDSRIHCGPVWDYDRALGSYGNSFGWDDPLQIGKHDAYYEEMMQHVDVQLQLQDKLHDNFIPYAQKLMSADVYYLGERLAASACMDNLRWPKIYGYYADYSACTDYLVNFVKQKTDYLASVWAKEDVYCTVTFLGYNEGQYDRYVIKKGEFLSYIPTHTADTAIFDGWYDVDTGNKLDVRLPILQDTTYESRWITLEDILNNGMDFEEINVLGATPELLRKIADRMEGK